MLREMISPIVETRMKEAGQLPRLRINAGQVCSLVKIAMLTCEREVFQRVLSVV